MNKTITYNLHNKENNSDTFYKLLEALTDTILSNSFKKSGFIIDGYYQYVQKNNLEKPRTREEYMLEYITIGVLWHNYAEKAKLMPDFSEALLTYLYETRRKYPKLKSTLDRIRGISSYYLLERRAKKGNSQYTLDNFRTLIKWLRSTGEYNEEILRFTNWDGYLTTLDEKNIAITIRLTVEFSNEFNTISHQILGEYTENVNKFRNLAKKTYKYREDYFFARRMKNEYYLNMFGAEVMNRQLKDFYNKTKEKAVLLPTCMRNNKVSNCRAKWDGKGNVCSRCDKNCNIGKIADDFRKNAVNVYLIPHSSNFSSFLKYWSNQEHTGLIGVACVLNLLTGGYEMKRLNIASQCVFLDYCSCKKHWDTKGYNTSLNINQLRQVVGVKQKELSYA